MSDQIEASNLTTRSWREFWEGYPASLDERDFLKQVGHTLDGQAYSADQFESLVNHIAEASRLGPEDRLLDLCCGNGVVTSRLAKRCGYVLGLDFSESLIAIARRHHSAVNADYLVRDATDLGNDAAFSKEPFTRVTMYAALQHFQPEDLGRLLRGIRTHLAPGGVILLGAVLDVDRKHCYLDTPEKRLRYDQYCRDGLDRLGTWWDKRWIQSACEEQGLECVIDDTSGHRIGGHYRFDALVS